MRLHHESVDVRLIAAILHADLTDELAHRHRMVATRSPAPLRILVTRRTMRDQLRDVQRQLQALGYALGDVDGRTWA